MRHNDDLSVYYHIVGVQDPHGWDAGHKVEWIESVSSELYDTKEEALEALPELRAARKRRSFYMWHIREVYGIRSRDEN
jgi:hypothetical protein